VYTGGEEESGTSNIINLYGSENYSLTTSDTLIPFNAKILDT